MSYTWPVASRYTSGIEMSCTWPKSLLYTTGLVSMVSCTMSLVATASASLIISLVLTSVVASLVLLATRIWHSISSSLGSSTFSSSMSGTYFLFVTITTRGFPFHSFLIRKFPFWSILISSFPEVQCFKHDNVGGDMQQKSGFLEAWQRDDCFGAILVFIWDSVKISSLSTHWKQLWNHPSRTRCGGERNLNWYYILF